MGVFKTVLLLLLMLIFAGCGDGSTKSSLDTRSFVLLDPPEFYTIKDAEINKVYSSNEIYISDFDKNLTIFVDNAYLVVDGQELSDTVNEITITKPTSIAIKLKSSSLYNSSTIATLYINELQKDFLIYTKRDLTVDNFTFNDIIDANLSKTYLSNTITIKGIDPFLKVDAVITAGTLIYNGFEIIDNNISVSNGDTLAIKLRSSSDYSITTESTLDINGVKEVFSITTYPKITQILLTNSELTMTKNDKKTISYTISPSNAPAGVNWKSSNDLIVSTSLNNNSNSIELMSVGLGKAIITATSIYDESVSASLGVSVVDTVQSVNINSISISPSQMTMSIGKEKTLTALPNPSTGNEKIIWGSNQKSVATVSSNGVIKALAPGMATIFAYLENNLSISASANIFVEVSIPVEKQSSLATKGSVKDLKINNLANTVWYSDSSPGIKALSLSSNNQLSEIASLDLPGYAENIKIGRNNNRVYVANGYAGIKLINISTPTVPNNDVNYTTGYGVSGKYATDLAISKDESRVFVSTKNGIELFDFNDKTKLINVDFKELNASSDIVLSSDDKMAFIGTTNHLYVYDVTKDSLDLNQTYHSKDCTINTLELSKSDRTIYIGCKEGQIDIVNLETNTSIGKYQTTQGSVEGLKLDLEEKKLYVAKGLMGVLVLDLSFYDTINEVIEPRAISAYNTIGYASSIDLIESSKEKTKIIVADGGNGILILQ